MDDGTTTRVPATVSAAAVGTAPRRQRATTTILRLALLIGAVVALRRELAGLEAAHLLAAARALDAGRVTMAVGATVGSFVLLGVIEQVALRQSGRGRLQAPIPRRSAMATAFVASAFGQSIGLSLFTGAAVRLRAYARHGLDAVAVARVTAIATLTTTLGMMATAAAALLASDEPLLRAHRLASSRLLGVLLALPVLAYVAWSVSGRGVALGRGRWRVLRPSPAIALAQVALSALDWVLTGTVLFAFVPAAAGIAYRRLLRAYVLGQAVGMTSHVPAGAGVLEVMLVVLLAGSAPVAVRGAVVMAIVLFRVTYYLAPLVVAGAMATVVELRRSRDAVIAAHVQARVA